MKTFGIYGMPNHAASDTYVRAVDQVVGGVPLLIPANGAEADIAALITRLDGLLFTGSRSNVAPENYGGPPQPEGAPEDLARDATTLPLLRAAIMAGVPVLAICRGLQELNVALGGTLIQKLSAVPGRLTHLGHESDREARYAARHQVRLSGRLAEIIGAAEIMVNSVHEQAIDRPAPALVIEATAPDGTIEGVRAADAKGFAIGVQWHPEWRAGENTASRRLFAAFAAACRDRQKK